MNLDTADSLELLRAGVPALNTGDELILRPHTKLPTATIRRGEGEPEIYALAESQCLRLDPRFDAGLPGASLIGNEAACQKALGSMLGELKALSLVAWRPERRAVLKIETQGGATHWLKLLDRKSYRRAEVAFSQLLEMPKGLRLMSPEFMLSDICGYVASSASGVALRELISRGAMLDVTPLLNVLRLLERVRIGGDLPEFQFEDARKVTLGVLRKANGSHPSLERLDAVVRSLPVLEPMEGGPRFVHGDLHDKQVFFGDDGASLIDLEGSMAGDSRFDAVNLAEHLRLRKLQEGSEDFSVVEGFLFGLDWADDERALRSYQVVIRARLCGVYALRPRWTRIVDRMAAETLELAKRL